MSWDNVHHVLEKSQSKGSARTLLLTVAIHCNDCCGVAWPSDTTLRHEVNVSRQRIHELKNNGENAGELLIIERPGTTNLYFIAEGGKPVGLTLEMLLDGERAHCRGCPLADPTLAQQVAKALFPYRPQTPGEEQADVPAYPAISPEPEGWPPKRQAEGREDASSPVETSPHERTGVSEPPDPQVSEMPDGGCQGFLTQKYSENEKEKNVVNVASHRSKQPTPVGLSEREEALAQEFARHLDGDHHSLGAIRRIVSRLGDAIAYRLFDETMEQEEQRKIKTTPGRYFMDLAKREASRQGIALGFRKDKA